MTEQQNPKHKCELEYEIFCVEQDNKLWIGFYSLNKHKQFIQRSLVNFCPMCGYKIPEKPKLKTIDQIDLKSALQVIESAKTLAVERIRYSCNLELEIANRIYESIIEEFENKSVTKPNHLEDE